jgi:hypothetical protein
VHITSHAPNENSKAFTCTDKLDAVAFMLYIANLEANAIGEIT